MLWAVSSLPHFPFLSSSHLAMSYVCASNVPISAVSSSNHLFSRVKTLIMRQARQLRTWCAVRDNRLWTEWQPADKVHELPDLPCWFLSDHSDWIPGSGLHSRYWELVDSCIPVKWDHSPHCASVHICVICAFVSNWLRAAIVFENCICKI